MNETIKQCEECGSRSLHNERNSADGNGAYVTFCICKNCDFNHGPYTTAKKEEREFEKD